MTLSSILQQISKKGKIQPKLSTTNTDTKNDLSSNFRAYKSNATSERPIDPVVAKLKEKRRLEREKKEHELRLKKGLAPKPNKTTTKPSKTGIPSSPKKSTYTQTTTKPVSRVSPPSSAPSQGISNDLRKKKLNFNELMKKASKIDHDKLSIKFPAKSKSPEIAPTRTKTPDRSINKNLELKKDEKRKKLVARVPPVSRVPPPAKQTTVKTPLPTRKPSEKIQQILKDKKNTSKKKHYEEYDEEDDELSSFIESDEEDAYDSRDYDRDEIWAMFNRGKKRSYYEQYDDYDSGDDMEATGAEILDEEYRSRVKGELEDRRELEQEKKLAALKKARFNKSR